MNKKIILIIYISFLVVLFFVSFMEFSFSINVWHFFWNLLFGFFITISAFSIYNSFKLGKVKSRLSGIVYEFNKKKNPFIFYSDIFIRFFLIIVLLGFIILLELHLSLLFYIYSLISIILAIFVFYPFRKRFY